MSEARYEVNVTTFPEAIAAIRESQGTRALVGRYADSAAFALRASAPVRSGAGRASIRSATEHNFEAGWVGTASWDDEHYYMGIQNSRTSWASKAARSVRYS